MSYKSLRQRVASVLGCAQEFSSSVSVEQDCRRARASQRRSLGVLFLVGVGSLLISCPPRGPLVSALWFWVTKVLGCLPVSLGQTAQATRSGVASQLRCK